MLERKHTTEHGIPEETGSCIDALSKHPGRQYSLEHSHTPQGRSLMLRRAH